MKEIKSITRHKNGSSSFEMQIGDEWQRFTVLPESLNGRRVTIQSKTRIGYLDISTGKGLISLDHSAGGFMIHLLVDRLTPFEIDHISVFSLALHLLSCETINKANGLRTSEEEFQFIFN